jgi:hypothetical protein
MKRILLTSGLLFAAVLTALFLNSCTEDLLEVKETIHSAEDNAIIETEFTALYDVLDDIGETDENLGKTESTILPSGAEISYLDTSFADGDGLELLIDFGPLGTDEPQGMLCKDGKYRAGKIRATLNKAFKEVGSIFEVVLSEDDQYFSGDGSNMVQLLGRLTVIRTGENTIRIEVVNGVAKTDGREIQWNLVNRVINRTKDAGPGVWGDHFEITGNAQGINRNGEEFAVNIDQALVKKMEVGCAKTFVKGRYTISVNKGAKTIMVDYDPFKDEACDRIAEADINGRKTTFTVR